MNAHVNTNGSTSSSTFIPVESFEIVVFGGTGDLARRKLIPSLYHRFRDGQIPQNSRIIGTSRSERSRQDYHKLITDAYHEFASQELFDVDTWAAFLKLVEYVAIDVTDETANWPALESLLSGAGDLTRIFYLATAGTLFSGICQGLKRAGLATSSSRVVLEKPLGKDLASATVINDGVGAVFDENRIYRIDHYLGKETVQNVLALRFGNILFEPLWSNARIDHIQITVAESIGTGGRGGYYDKSGALRDMVQNHILQLLCLTAMEAPASLSADDVRTEKIKVLRALRPVTGADVKTHTVRGQYVQGVVNRDAVKSYISDVNVDDSSTETFVAIKAHIDNWRWAGVPIYLRTGKRMTERKSEIVIQFKPVPHSVFGPNVGLEPNRLVIRLQPDEAVRLWLQIKEPGAGGMRVKAIPLNLTYADAFTVRYPDAYERLLMDVVRGNLSLFMRRDEVEAAWRYVDGIQDAWFAQEQAIQTYGAGTDGPLAAGLLVDRDGRAWWDQPAVAETPKRRSNDQTTDKTVQDVPS